VELLLRKQHGQRSTDKAAQLRGEGLRRGGFTVAAAVFPPGPPRSSAEQGARREPAFCRSKPIVLPRNSGAKAETRAYNDPPGASAQNGFAKARRGH
jgi:hypothetical protein